MSELLTAKALSQVKRSVSSIEKAIVWIRNDQRVLDNVSFMEAKKLNCPVICVYCFDKRHYITTQYRSLKSEVFRTNFLIQSIDNLRKNVNTLGSKLLGIKFFLSVLTMMFFLNTSL